MTDRKLKLNKKQKDFVAKERELYLETYIEAMNYQPAYELLADVANGKLDVGRERLAAITALMPYTIRKLPTAVESNGEVTVNVIDDRQKSLIASLDDNDVPELINIKPENVIEHEDIIEDGEDTD